MDFIDVNLTTLEEHTHNKMEEIGNNWRIKTVYLLDKRKSEQRRGEHDRTLIALMKIELWKEPLSRRHINIEDVCINSKLKWERIRIGYTQKIGIGIKTYMSNISMFQINA